jgi:hypothetical protein
MNTLKQIVDFVGIPQGSLASARYQYSEPWTMGLNNVNLLVTRGAKPASMRNIIEILQNLTPITLEAEIVGSLSGEEPFEPKIRVNASGGITWFTTIEFSLLGVPNAPVYSHDVSNSGGDFTPTQLGPGRWYLSVIRSGISNSGFVALRKQVGTITVSASSQPTPTPTPIPPIPIPTPPTPVFINVSIEFGVGGLENRVLRITGSGFTLGGQVELQTTTRVDSDNPSTGSPQITTADNFGSIDFKQGVFCIVGRRTTFQVQAIDLASSERSNIAGASC